jgi:hypothetical protein
MAQYQQVGDDRPVVLQVPAGQVAVVETEAEVLVEQASQRRPQLILLRCRVDA